MKPADAGAILGLAMVDAMTPMNFAGAWWEVTENVFVGALQPRPKAASQ
jgi:hypothetical protein